MGLQEMGCGRMDWIELAHDEGQVAFSCKCGNETSDSIKCGISRLAENQLAS